jgi:CIC family chloride channel protein
MEVVIMEYSVIGFTPVILAAVSATTLTRVMFGDETAFTVPDLQINSLQELPVVAFMGALIGCLAAAFIQLSLFASSLLSKQAIWIRTTLAGIITGVIAVALPEVMGTGYDTVDGILLMQVSVVTVVLLTFAKTITSAIAIGLGIPAGLIGPTLFIGAAAGGAFASAIGLIYPAIGSTAFYATLGMAAMMAAVLQAPLAALIYLLELTADHAIILPGMITVITASLITRVVFGKSSIYQHLMLARGLDYRNSSLSRALRRIGVASVMERNIIQQPRMISRAVAEQILKQEPRWILLTNDDNERKTCLLPATDLARYIIQLNTQTDPNKQDLDLLKIPAKRIDTAATTIVATLQEAHELMQAEQCEVLFIRGAHGESKQRIYGVITREHIESSYRV